MFVSWSMIDLVGDGDGGGCNGGNVVMLVVPGCENGGGENGGEYE